MTIYKYDHMALGTVRWCSKFKVAGLLRFIFLHLKLLLPVSWNVKNNGSNPKKHSLKMKRGKKKTWRNPDIVKKVPRSYTWRSDVLYTFPESLSFLEQHWSGHSSLPTPS
jgi:hypothetical protein